MATKDFQDIVGKEGAAGRTDKEKGGRLIKVAKRPKGMSREVYNLFAHGPNENELNVVGPGDRKSAVQNIKANIAFRRTRRWNWKPFVNEARTDGVKFNHWEREDHKQHEPYVFAAFQQSEESTLPIYSIVFLLQNKVDVVSFTDEEFERVLRPIAGQWTLEATRHLLEKCAQLDLRWHVIFDRFDRYTHGLELTLEDLKEWFYKLTNAIRRAQSSENPPFYFDAEHERRRKEQLEILWNRTEEEASPLLASLHFHRLFVQIKEEEYLKSQMKVLEVKRKEREKRAQELQRLINSSERSTVSPETNGAIAAANQQSRQNRRLQKNRSNQLAAQLFASETSTNLRFSEFRSAGPHLRSQEMKLPSNVGQKKMKAIEQAIEKYKLSVTPHAYEEVVKMFNELRTKVVFAQELRTSLQTTEQDLSSMQHVRQTVSRQTSTAPTELFRPST
ncbi:hypothetical protein M3Y99_01097100 [Aphelenchoides fujianensis]|nr:hypothetical protein M3Y99_01097100 [Aphelenchoides fujianensis]